MSVLRRTPRRSAPPHRSNRLVTVAAPPAAGLNRPPSCPGSATFPEYFSINWTMPGAAAAEGPPHVEFTLIHTSCSSIPQATAQSVLQLSTETESIAPSALAYVRRTPDEWGILDRERFEDEPR